MKTIIETFLEKVADDLIEVDAEQAYGEMLAEEYSFECVGGPFKSMSPSRVLKSCDEVAYRRGLNDYIGEMRDGHWWQHPDTDVCYDRDEIEKFRDDLVSELMESGQELDAEILEDYDI